MILGTAITAMGKRARDNRLMLVVAFITVMLATTLMAASPLYSAAVSLAGIRQSLSSAPPDDVAITVSASSKGNEYTTLDQRVTAALQGALGSTGGSIVRWGSSESYALPGQTEGHNLAVFRYAEHIDGHAMLVSGTWPSSPPGVVEAAISGEVADQLGLGVGDERRLTNPIDDAQIVVRISGIYQPDELDDPYWHGDALISTGVDRVGSFATYGPFIVSRQTLLTSLSPRPVTVDWYAMPEIGSLTVGDLQGMRNRIAILPASLGAQSNSASTIHVTTKLPELIATNERSLLATRAAVLAVSIQLALLALYALVLTAGLLADQRALEIGLLRARGASVRQIATFTAVEGVALTIPAILLAPPVAAVMLRTLNHVGPLAGIGLTIDPSVSREAYAFASAAGLVCFLALTLPTTLMARSVLEARAERGRHRRLGWAVRMGLDLALLGVAVVGYLQLRHYHAPVTSTIGGRERIDPLLVAVPGLVLAAGAVLTLRVLPLLGRAVERLARRDARLVPALVAWGVARRPTRLGRMTLLLVLALGIGLFAATYSATWTTSQDDQARYQVGADIRLERDQRPTAIPSLFLASAYTQLGGVRASMPVQMGHEQISSESGSVDMVMLDSAAAPEVVQVRHDLAAPDFATLMGRLTSARPTTARIDVPGKPARIALDLWWTMQQLCPGSAGTTQAPNASLSCRDVPSDWTGKQQQWSAPLSPAIVIRDASGRIYRLTAVPMPSTDVDHQGATRRVAFPLRYTLPDGTVVSPQFPISVVAIELDFLAPSFAARAGQLEVRSILVSSDPNASDWQPLSLSNFQDPKSWSTSTTAFNSKVGDSPQATVVAPPETAIVRVNFTSGALYDQTSLPATISLRPSGSTPIGAIPAIASNALLQADALHVGDTLRIPLDGRDRDVVLVGAIDAFPTIGANDPALIFDLQTLDALQLAEPGNRTGDPDQRWIAVQPGSTDRLAERLVASPFRSTDVVSQAERARALRTDPVILGMLGALSSGFLAAVVFAVTGFLLNIVVTARERRTELALLRALGLSTRQLGSWLLLEHAFLVGCGVILGAILGLTLAWLVLPLIALSHEAAVVFPPPVIVVPWGQITLLQVSLVATLALAGGLAVVLLRHLGLGQSLRMGEE